ncbi:MAG: hypothetical protein LBI13_07900 [Streptococcaceae bacterium]|jgi:hypothetical protein|nr:hypothetical protein [Streptococcaceae bacterium]
MKKLGDESYDYREGDLRRTIWYQAEEDEREFDEIFGEPDPYGGRQVLDKDFTEIAEKIKGLVQTDLSAQNDLKASETQWVFYSSLINGDAVGDKVRFTILLREKAGKFDCTINMSDYIFASSFEQVEKLKQAILQELL